MIVLNDKNLFSQQYVLIEYDSLIVQNWVGSNMQFYSTLVLSPPVNFLFLIQLLVEMNLSNKLNLSVRGEYKVQY